MRRCPQAGCFQGHETLSDTRPPTIACNLNEIQMARLAEHPSRPVVIPYLREGQVWEVPPEADILSIFFRGRHQAPSTPPPGWPHRLRWVQIAGAGVDASPTWVFDAPVVTCGRGECRSDRGVRDGSHPRAREGLLRRAEWRLPRI